MNETESISLRIGIGISIAKKRTSILNPFFSILIGDTCWKFLACLVIMLTMTELANPGLKE